MYSNNLMFTLFYTSNWFVTKFQTKIIISRKKIRIFFNMDSKSVESKFNANCHFFSVKLDCVKKQNKHCDFAEKNQSQNSIEIQ